MAPLSPQNRSWCEKPTIERRSGRLLQLDGLRGLASLVVVVHHVFLTSAVFGNIAEGSGRPELFSGAWWLSYTPIHLIWGGTEAVFIFFVLSGYVLASQMSNKPKAWPTYYAGRMPRLYLPSIASVFLAVALASLVPRDAVSGSSVWLNHHVGPGVESVLRNSTLLFGVDTLNSPLWSLQWEVWFSLLLPVYLWVAGKIALQPGVGVFVAGMLFVLMFLGSVTDVEALKYLPVFALGVLTFRYRDLLGRIAGSMQRGPGLLWPSFILVSILSLMAYWLVQMPAHTSGLVVSASHFPQIMGAWTIVFIVLHSQRAEVMLTRPWMLWLGSRSFSLYLVHEPIVVSLALLFGPGVSVWQVLLASVPLSLVVSEVFFRCIERPSHIFSRRLSLQGAGRQPTNDLAPRS